MGKLWVAMARSIARLSGFTELDDLEVGFKGHFLKHAKVNLDDLCKELGCTVETLEGIASGENSVVKTAVLNACHINLKTYQLNTRQV